jgi:high-affinity iron transporter
MRRTLFLLCILFASIMTPRFASAHEPTGNPYTDVYELNTHIQEAILALVNGDTAKARSEYAHFDDGWFSIENGVREASRQSYRDIERAMGDARFALKQEPIDPAAAMAALEVLATTNDAFIDTAGAALTSSGQASDSSIVTLASELPKLDEALDALKTGDLAYARAEVQEFRTVWPDVEDVVAAKDGTAYRQAEELQAQAAAQIASGQIQPAIETLSALKATLQPFATEKQRYSVLDATSIVPRQGIAAVLIIAALLAVLQRLGNADKGRWIWLGAVAGILASSVTVIAIQQLFSTGTNRGLIEGISGLAAAALLLYVSYWLHAKSRLGGWQRSIQDPTYVALGAGSLLLLAGLACLSVFHASTKIALLYIGIAPMLALRDVLLSIGIGSAILAIGGVVVIGLGKRLPLPALIQLSSLLIWYLGFKLIGSGIRALQTARVVQETQVSWLPSSDLLGLYPSWETSGPQLVLLLAAIGLVIWTRSLAKQAAQIELATTAQRNTQQI